MKKAFKKISFALLSAAILFNFAACSSGDGDSSGSGLEIPPATPVKLPESSGENPFKGKTFTTNSYTETTFIFSETSVVVIEKGEDYETQNTYAYTYDADNSLLYLNLKKIQNTFDNKTYSWSSTSEYINLMLSNPSGNKPSADAIAYDTASANNDFSLLNTYKYTITGNEIKLTSYFNGQLPTNDSFYFYDYQSGLNISSNSNRFLIENDNSEIRYEGFPTFTADTFTVTIFKTKKKDYENYTKIGTIKGTYKTEGTGTDNCKIILTFTEMPEELSSYKDKEVTLSNY